jgi:hypothetical protein
MKRRARPNLRRRRDANEKEIVAALRKLGATVEHIDGVGEGVPDLLIGYRGTNRLAEVKVQKGKKSKGQVDWSWNGEQPVLMRSVDDAIMWMREWTRREP